MTNTSVTSHHTGSFLKLYAILAATIVCNYIAWTSWDVTFVMNDAIQYLSTTKNWLMGKGVSTNALIYNPHFQGVLPAPQTVWPPGFPAVLLVSGYLRLELQSAALLVNLLSMGMAGLLFYAILRRCQVSQSFSLCSAAVFYFTCSLWHQALSLLSEPLFNCLVLAAVCCLPRRNLYFKNWLLCSFFLALCITVRHSGVFTATAFFFALSIIVLFDPYYRTLSITGRLLRLCVLMILPVVTFVSLMLRTHYLIGTVERDTGIGSTISVVDTIQITAQEASVLMGFRDGWLFTGDIDTWLFMLLVLLVSVMITTFAVVILCDVKFQKSQSCDTRGNTG